MTEREAIIRLWFDMWLQQKDLGIEEIFTEDVTYIESWRPRYDKRETVAHWFKEWNQRAKVTTWDIEQFFHKADQTVVVWRFACQMKDGASEAFDGMSLIQWTADHKITFLKEFACSINQYNPYDKGLEPVFRDDV